ncbi:MAG: hypothetical protein DRJ03_00580 [Chloroflexi bacterium]|nr:MAG: hypothetical protein DRJ03_00580 [Chloroflexota bacterium]
MSILVGEEHTFCTGDVRGQVVMPVDENTCAVFYQKDDSGYPVYLLAATRDGTDLTLGSGVLVRSGNYQNNDNYSALGICQYDTDQVCVKFNDDTGPFGWLGLASISGTTVSLGDVEQYAQAGDDCYGDPATLTSGSRIFCSQREYSRVTNVTGTTIDSQTARFRTFWGSYAFHSIGVCDSGRVLIFARKNTPEGKTRNMTVVGDSMTNKTESNFVASPVDPYYLNVTPLHDAEEFVVTFVDQDDGYTGQIVHASRSGDTAAYGDIQIWNSGTVKCVSSVVYGDNNIDIVYIDTDDASKLKILQGTVSGTVFSFPDSPLVIHGGGTAFVHKAQLFNDRYCMVAYEDTDDSNYGKAVVVDLDPPLGTGSTFGTCDLVIGRPFAKFATSWNADGVRI